MTVNVEVLALESVSFNYFTVVLFQILFIFILQFKDANGEHSKMDKTDHTTLTFEILDGKPRTENHNPMVIDVKERYL